MRRGLLTAVTMGAVAAITPGGAAADPDPAETRDEQPQTPRDLLLEYARVRGVIDACTQSGNRIDFQSLIDRLSRHENRGLWQSLRNGAARYRAELQGQVNAVYTSHYSAAECGSAGDLAMQTGRAEAIWASLNSLLPPAS